MLHIFLENGVLSRKTVTIFSALLLSPAIGGCSTVMSKDEASYVGVIADYTPFDMEDDSSIFSNKQPKIPAYLQKSSFPMAQAAQRPTPARQTAKSLTQIAPKPAQSPVVDEQRKSVTTTAAIIPASASIPVAALDTVQQKTASLKQVLQPDVAQPEQAKTEDTEIQKTLTAHIPALMVPKAEDELAQTAENMHSGSASLFEGEPYEGTPEMTSMSESGETSNLITQEKQDNLN